jgi:DNA mismatch endonuclease Vsr
MSGSDARRSATPRASEITSRIMAAVRAKNTEPERLLRSALFRIGLRFRVHAKKLPGRPDIVLDLKDPGERRA